jgi:excisionase family DNA binding protein
MQSQRQTALTIAEFCQKLNIHRSTFYRNVKKGLMPPIIKVGSATRILVEDEQAWLCTQRQRASEYAAS